MLHPDPQTLATTVKNRVTPPGPPAGTVPHTLGTGAVNDTGGEGICGLRRFGSERGYVLQLGKQQCGVMHVRVGSCLSVCNLWLMCARNMHVCMFACVCVFILA